MNTTSQVENPVFVVHARKYAEREQHVSAMLSRHGLKARYVLDGDVDDLSADVLSAYFCPSADGTPGLLTASPAASCAVKHFLAYKAVVDEHLPGALVVEDDIFLHDDFREKYEQSLAELNRRYASAEPVLISYEDSALIFVPRSMRRPAEMLYHCRGNRFTGCYYVNNAACKAMIDEVMQHKTNLPIDHFHQHCDSIGVITYLFSEPCLATQGSANGEFITTVGRRRSGRSFASLRWTVKLAYKRLLYWFR